MQIKINHYYKVTAEISTLGSHMTVIVLDKAGRNQYRNQLYKCRVLSTHWVNVHVGSIIDVTEKHVWQELASYYYVIDELCDALGYTDD